MRQELVDKVKALVGDEGGDESFVRAELARAHDDLRYGSARLRPAATILRREEPDAALDEDALVRLAARRVLSLGGTPMPAREEGDDRRVGVATRSYAAYSFGSRCELARENAAPENRAA
jgi:hypothetical protein